jgi:hypothetical protein
MATSDITRLTPITTRADRHDERVRLIEESVLLLRGDWPAVATGLCESINRPAGIFRSPRALEEAICETCRESLQLVERLYGEEGTAEVRRLATADQALEPQPSDRVTRPRRLHLPHRNRVPST